MKAWTAIALWLVIFLAVLAAVAVVGLYVKQQLQQSGVTNKLTTASNILSALSGGSSS